MANSGTSVAFESIDGPPPQVFDRLVSVLDSESKLRDLSVVSREGSASYRVRGYLAAEVSRGRTTIAWVWDVYDSNQQRALRLSGEEPAGKAGRDAWSGADDLVLRKIAQAGFSGLSAMINGTGAGGCAASRPGTGQTRPGGGRRANRRPRAALPSAPSPTATAKGANSCPTLGFCAGKAAAKGCQPRHLLDITSLVETAGSVGIPIC